MERMERKDDSDDLLGLVALGCGMGWDGMEWNGVRDLDLGLVAGYCGRIIIISGSVIPMGPAHWSLDFFDYQVQNFSPLLVCGSLGPSRVLVLTSTY